MRDQALLLARVNTHYRPLHGHPRFQRVLEQVGLGQTRPRAWNADRMKPLPAQSGDETPWPKSF